VKLAGISLMPIGLAVVDTRRWGPG
jgi:hypothetical protein